MRTAEHYATDLVGAYAAGVGPTDIGWVREGGHDRGGRPVTVTLPDGSKRDLLACSSCDTLWPLERGLQACHIIPARAIVATVDAMARAAGMGERARTTLKRWARRYAHPDNVVPGCYECNDDHEA